MKKCILMIVFIAIALCGCDNNSNKKKDPLGEALKSSKHEVTGKLNEHPIQNDPFDQPRK
jgi:hypothetical protein